MKYLVVSVIMTIVLGLFAFKAAEENVKSQSEALAGIDPNQEYVTYRVNQNENGYSFARQSYANKITEKSAEKTLPNKHFQLMVEIDSRDASLYLPDNMAFPLAYRPAIYEGNKQTKETIGYIPSKVRTGMNESRLVFLDGLIYNLTQYYGPEKYWVWSVSVPKGYGKEAGAEEETGGKKKKMSLKDKLKAMKDMATSGGDAATKKLVSEDAIGKLEAYMKAAAAKQKKVEAAWANSKEGKIYIEGMKLKRDAWAKFVRKDREEYFNSEEYRRIVENNRLADAARAESAKSEVVIKNTGTQSICVSHSGGSRSISAGGSASFKCDMDISYCNGGLIVGADQHCGGTVTIQ
ncbi:hypothetical protein [Bernardetia sp.]|uniref:hypothetical protein n=1 Tax=Bernardetia sp. TaxID=1937974 RepID=UPI0025B85EEE|nr:hypothetical protein [Bernardetia sp.]